MQLITGNKFKKICDYIYEGSGLVKTEINNQTPIFFVKTDYVHSFFQNHTPEFEFKIITHNSDYQIDSKFINYLENSKLKAWFGQNVVLSHPKLFSIPIGIANEIWEHGNEQPLVIQIEKQEEKNNLIYCNFEISTNFFERSKCLNTIKKYNLKLSERKKFENYLEELSKSYFCLSPNGNGIDCHKTWESLYLKTIPVITKSLNYDFYRELPFIVIDDWDTFNPLELTEDLYYNTIKKFSLEKIDFNFFKNKILNY